MRRVVTGHTPDGKAIIASDTELSGDDLRYNWGSDEPPTIPDDGSQHPFRQGSVPPVGGFRFGVFTVAPQSTSGPKAGTDGPGIRFEKDAPGMHTTDTVDFEYVISGEVWLELDDGVEVLLRAGDVVVQNGTRHAWRNKSSEPCRLVACMIGAHRK